jgi:hypothetical protein
METPKLLLQEFQVVSYNRTTMALCLTWYKELSVLSLGVLHYGSPCGGSIGHGKCVQSVTLVPRNLDCACWDHCKQAHTTQHLSSHTHICTATIPEGTAYLLVNLINITKSNREQGNCYESAMYCMIFFFFFFSFGCTVFRISVHIHYLLLLLNLIFFWSIMTFRLIGLLLYM